MTGPSILQRPILGGVFGAGRYALATVPCVVKGLHSVRYMVIDPRAGTVLSAAEDKTAALAAARRVIRASAALADSQHQATAMQGEQGRLWTDEQLASLCVPPRPKPISRRRRVVFARSEGRCHYCSTPLTLDGRWHVEHQLPRALGGADEPSNLVAACPTCNLKKADATAIEFMTRQSECHD